MEKIVNPDFSDYTYKMYFSKIRFIHRIRLDIILSYLRYLRLNNLSIAEIGGADLFLLYEVFRKKIIKGAINFYIDIDIFQWGTKRFAQKTLSFLKKRGFIKDGILLENRCKNIDITKIGAEKFDITIACEVIEHLGSNEINCLNNIINLMTKNGVLILSVPIEYGCLFAIKEIGRLLISGHSAYFLRDYIYATFGQLTKIERSKGGHKGYDYRKTFRYLYAKGLILEKMDLYPFKNLSWLNYGVVSLWRKKA